MRRWIDRGRMAGVLAALLVAGGAGAGCEKPWQTARTVVVATAEGVAAADRAVVEAYGDSGCASTEDVEDLRRCVAQLEATTTVLVTARESVRVGETLVDGWERAQTEPTEWQGWLLDASQLALRLVALLEAAGVEVPGELAEWSTVIDGYLEGLRERED